MPPVPPKSWREHRKIMKIKKWQRASKYLETVEKHNEELKMKMNESELNPEVKLNILSRAAPFLKTAPTLSIALPGSILDNAQTQEFRSYLAGQIARAACIYNIREIVIFDDMPCKNEDDHCNSNSWKSCEQMGNILQYLECPQYLRKRLFPMCDDLKYVGLLNPLDAPHHLRAMDESPYREGVVTEIMTKSGTKSYAEVGLDKPIRIDRLLPKATRVTLKLKNTEGGKLRGQVVTPEVPTQEEGLYWGYSVRLAERLGDVFCDGPYGQYDYVIGTSDKGEPISKLTSPKPGFKHGLLIFGGVKGLEYALVNDPNCSETMDDVTLLFEAYVNTCPSQGSRTIRTEEALLISLAVITPKLGLA